MDEHRPNTRDRAAAVAMLLATIVLTSATTVAAADEVVLGKKIVVKDPPSEKRLVIALGKENPTDIGVTGQSGLDPGDDPETNGASLTVVTTGAAAAAQTFSLPAGTFDGPTVPGWKRTAVGFLYKDPQNLNGPVKVVLVKRTPGDVFLLKALVNGVDPGIDALRQVDVEPPNLGTGAGVILAINGGNRYCVRWGGTAGGEIKRNDAAVFLLVATAALPTTEAGCASVTSSTITPTTSTTTSTVQQLCGNGQINAGETCDDGNQSNNDACPSDCSVDACTPLTGTARPFDVYFAPQAGVNVGGITVLVDYPEGKVEIPGPPVPGGIITNLPLGAFPITVDLNHALREIVAQSGGSLPPGRLFRVNFRDCSGAALPTAAEFTCTVLEATDPFSNPVTNEVTCNVVAP